MTGQNAQLPDTTSIAWHLNEQGLSVIPLGSPFEEPPHWFTQHRCDGDRQKAQKEWPKTPRIQWKAFQQQAPTDQQLEQWTRNWPNTNWAIVTGQPVIVVDADSPAAVDWLESGGITPTPVRVTTRQGKHFYFAANPTLDIRNSARKNKIDIRGAGGYVVAPGSTHATGTRYQWEIDEHYPLSELLDLPVLKAADLKAINAFNASKKNRSHQNATSGSNTNSHYSHLKEGEGRNNAAAKITGQLIRQGNTLRDIKEQLDSWNQGNQPPLSPTELNTTIASIARTHLHRHPGETIPVETPAFGFVPLDELLNRPKPVNWLVKGFLETDSLAILFGEPGCGKSFIALDIACALATGNQWQGHPVHQQGPVFYIAGEGHNGLSRRLLAWQQHHSQSLKGAPIYPSQSAASLIDPAHARIVSDQIATTANRVNQTPALIIIDTLARNFGPGDENATKEMNLFISHIDQLFRARFNCCVLVVHHTGVAHKDRARGNSALKGAADAEYAVMKTGDQLMVIPKKMKDADEPPPLPLTLQPVTLSFTDSYGEPQTSCVLNRANKETHALSKPQALGKAQQGILDSLYQLVTAITTSPDEVTQTSIAIQQWKRVSIGEDKPVKNRQNWSRTQATLVEKKLIQQVASQVCLTEAGYQLCSKNSQKITDRCNQSVINSEGQCNQQLKKTPKSVIKSNQSASSTRNQNVIKSPSEV